MYSIVHVSYVGGGGQKGGPQVASWLPLSMGQVHAIEGPSFSPSLYILGRSKESGLRENALAISRQPQGEGMVVMDIMVKHRNEWQNTWDIGYVMIRGQVDAN